MITTRISKCSMVFLTVLTLFFTNAFAQKKTKQLIRNCATMEVYHKQVLANPDMESLNDFETWMQTGLAKNATQSAEKQGVIYTIPIIVHVIHNGEAVGNGTNISQAQVNSQIDVLNEDFRRILGTPGYNTNPVGADVEIEFCPALVDEAGNVLAEPGINRVNRNTAGFSAPAYGDNYIDNTIKPATVWNPDDYMNVWVMSMSGGILGYAQFPETSLAGMSTAGQDPDTDGVVIGYNYFGNMGNVSAPFDAGRTATHEVGHYLGLRHIWGDGGCGVDDYCDDTPASDGANYGCPNTTSCSSVDMVENYMDYTDDACMNIFTIDQTARMRFVMENSPRRASLLNSNACGVLELPPVASFSADVVAGCPGLTVQFTDNSSFGPQSWSWTFPGGVPATSTDANPVVTYSTLGDYDVTLSVTNSFGNNTAAETAYITVSDNGTEVFWVEDFESNDLAGSGWTIINPDGNNSWETVGVSGNTPGSTAARVDHYNNEYVGERDAMISPVIDLSTHTNNQLDFEHAHRRYSQNEADSLIVYISTDGGQTFPTRLFANAEDGTGSFATNVTTTADFVPASADDWCFSGGVGASCVSLDLSAYDGEADVRLKFETYNDYGNNLYIDNIQVSGTCNSVVVPEVIVKAQVWLEGAYDNTVGLMVTTLRTDELVPLANPYNRPPWEYLGGESVAAYSDMNTQVVDWVLLEARDPVNNEVLIESHAALLLSNGLIVDADGLTDGVRFPELTVGNAYYLVVRHRNHLAILAANTAIVPNATPYDFTEPVNVAGVGQLADLGDGEWGMLAGDFDSDGVVTVADFNLYSSQASLINFYLDGDCNLDRTVSVADYNLYQPNTSIIGVTQIRY